MNDGLGNSIILDMFNYSTKNKSLRSKGQIKMTDKYNNDYFFVELPHLFLTSTSRPIEDKTLKSISNCIN